jgi:hypothetical protein
MAEAAMNRHTAAVGVLVALLAALVAFGRTEGSAAPSTDAVPLPRADPAGALTSSWFCPSAQGGAAIVQATEIDITNPTSSTRTGTITWFAVADGKVTPQPFTVGPGALARLRNGTAATTPAASALVETEGGGVVVEQVVVGATTSSVAPCASDTSANWYLANGSTLVDATEVLSLFNPFPSDAVVDVEFSTEEGREAPGAVQGLVIPAGRTTFIDAGATVRRQAITATAVRARTGQLVVTRLQSFDGTAVRTGLSLALAARAAAPQWFFADAISSPTFGTTWHVFNPGTTEAEVRIEVMPVSGDPPEPIEITVPPRSQVAVPAARDGGVADSVAFASTVTSSNGVPIVVELTLDQRTPGQTGWSSSLGSPWAESSYALAYGDSSAATGGETLRLFNPGATPRTVRVSSITAAGLAPVPNLGAVVIPPAGRVVLPLATYVVSAAVGLEVRADGPIVVERWMQPVGKLSLTVTAGIPLDVSP